MTDNFPRGGVTPAQYVRSRGLNSLQQLSEESTKPISTLRDWYREQPILFDIIITGVLTKINERSRADNGG